MSKMGNMYKRDKSAVEEEKQLALITLRHPLALVPILPAVSNVLNPVSNDFRISLTAGPTCGL
jgi:hypothetical protein